MDEVHGGVLDVSRSDAGGVEISNVCGPVCRTVGAGPGGTALEVLGVLVE